MGWPSHSRPLLASFEPGTFSAAAPSDIRLPLSLLLSLDCRPRCYRRSRLHFPSYASPCWGGRKLTASPWHRGDFRGTPIISSVLWTLHELPAEVTVSGPTSARAALRSRASRLRAPGVSAFAVMNKEQSQPLCLGGAAGPHGTLSPSFPHPPRLSRGACSP